MKANFCELVKWMLDDAKALETGGVYPPDEIVKIKKALRFNDMQLISALILGMYNYYERNIDLHKEIQQLKDKNWLLKYENEQLLKAKQIKKGEVAINMVKAGAKPAKKSEADINIIKQLKSLGLSDEDIAKRLGVSRATIWRRRKEEEEKANEVYKKSLPF